MDPLTDMESQLRDAALQVFDKVGSQVDALTRDLALITQAVNEVARVLSVQRARFEDPNSPKKMN
jgi:hypothetical protein